MAFGQRKSAWSRQCPEVVWAGGAGCEGKGRALEGEDDRVSIGNGRRDMTARQAVARKEQSHAAGARPSLCFSSTSVDQASLWLTTYR